MAMWHIRYDQCKRRLDCRPLTTPWKCPFLVAWLAAIAALTCGNCGRVPEKRDRYVPAPELARAAVEAVLVDWEEGRPPGTIDRLAVTVNVVDEYRKKGQALAHFEILGETPSVSGRSLVVRLKYSQPEGEESARYVVIGINPLWVFRQEDLDMLNHWDHDMPAESPGTPTFENDEAQDPDVEGSADYDPQKTPGDRIPGSQ